MSQPASKNTLMPEKGVVPFSTNTRPLIIPVGTSPCPSGLSSFFCMMKEHQNRKGQHDAE